jgi:methionyl-tRNA formyltransferase
MKIIFMGTPEFSAPTLNKLLASKHKVIAVYTQKPKAAGRGMELKKSKIHEIAEKKKIPVFTPDSLKSAEEKNNFNALKADIAVVAAYGMLLPKEILNGTRFGCINIHPSLLPRWRGAAPLQRTIMEGDEHTAVCIMKMDEGLDTGDVILKHEFDIPETANCGWLHDQCSEIGAELIIKAIAQIESDEATFTKQTEKSATYAKKITKDDEKIDFTKKGKIVLDKIRALSPYPGAFFLLEGVKYKVFDALFSPAKNIKAGTVLNEKFHIACADGIIIPKTIQKEGKPKMDIGEFLNGNKVGVGKMVG